MTSFSPSPASLHGADGHVQRRADFVVSHVSVLTQQEHFLLLVPQAPHGVAQSRLAFLLEHPHDGVVRRGLHGLLLGQLLSPPTPGGLSDVSPRVQGDAKDPGSQVLNFADLLQMAPALHERLLQGVLGVLPAAGQIIQGAQQLSLMARKGTLQPLTVGDRGLGGG